MAIEFEFQLSINYKNLIAIGFIIFAIAALIFSFGVAFSSSSSNNEKEEICDTAKGWEENYEYCDRLYDELVEKDEKIHEEWAKENYDDDDDDDNNKPYPEDYYDDDGYPNILKNNNDTYQFVKCPNDNNTYPEGTKCNVANIDEDEIKDNDGATEQEEKAMKQND